MQITQTKKEKLKCEFTVTLTAGEIDTQVTAKLREIGATVKLPGFRPGKVPMSLLKTKYGSSVLGDVLDHLVQNGTVKAINENGLRPAGRPQIDVKKFDEKEGLEYHMVIELLPEIDIVDLGGLTLEKLSAKPAPADIQDTLQRLAKSNAGSEKVEAARAAKKGDIVVIDFDGTVDGKPFPGMKGADAPLELGSKSFIDTFEDQLTGAKAGESRTVTVTFPADYGQEQLRGVEAVFDVTVKELRVPVIPALDDAFAKTLGFESLAKLEEAVAQQMQADCDRLSRLSVKRALLDALDEGHDFSVPSGMADAEFFSIWRQAKGHPHEKDPGHKHGDDCHHEKPAAGEEDEYRAIAERRVRLGLVLAEIGRINKIEVTTQEMQKALMSEAGRYPGREQEVYDFYTKNPQMLESLRAPLYEDKVVDFVLARAAVSTREVSTAELNQALDKDDAPATAKKKAKKK